VSQTRILLTEDADMPKMEPNANKCCSHVKSMTVRKCLEQVSAHFCLKSS